MKASNLLALHVSLLSEVAEKKEQNKIKKQNKNNPQTPPPTHPKKKPTHSVVNVI